MITKPKNVVTTIICHLYAVLNSAKCLVTLILIILVVCNSICDQTFAFYFTCDVLNTHLS